MVMAFANGGSGHPGHGTNTSCGTDAVTDSVIMGVMGVNVVITDTFSGFITDTVISTLQISTRPRSTSFLWSPMMTTITLGPSFSVFPRSVLSAE